MNHPSPEKEDCNHDSDFSCFFKHATEEEKRELMLKVAKEATNEQRAQIGLPPPSEKEEYKVHRAEIISNGEGGTIPPLPTGQKEESIVKDFSGRPYLKVSSDVEEIVIFRGEETFTFKLPALKPTP